MNKINDAGRGMIIQDEKLELEAYPCPGSDLGKLCAGRGLPMSRYEEIPRWELFKGDPWTIGFGHTGPEVKPGLRWTEEQAWKALDQDIANSEQDVARAVTVPLNENQFSALVSLFFNVGATKLLTGDESGGPCDLLTKLNAGDYAGAADEFPKWRKSGGVVMAGLVRRRADERTLFLTPVRATA